MAWWAIELSEFSIQYRPRLALKGQVLADILAELPQLDANQGDTGWWILNVDAPSKEAKTFKTQKHFRNKDMKNTTKAMQTKFVKTR